VSFFEMLIVAVDDSDKSSSFFTNKSLPLSVCLIFLSFEPLQRFLTEEEVEELALESGETQAADRLVRLASLLTAITQLLLYEIAGSVLIRGDRRGVGLHVVSITILDASSGEFNCNSIVDPNQINLVVLQYFCFR
jgi:hypothetical protein